MQLLIIDDNIPFTTALATAMRTRGWDCDVAHNASQAIQLVQQQLTLTHVALDMKLGDESGLQLITPLLAANPQLHIVILTGYASIATTVAAMKLGAINYLAKPIRADELHLTLQSSNPVATVNIPIQASPPPPTKRVQWEHMQQVLRRCDGNVSEAARQLGLHRRSLQRMLAKHAP